ncbi:acyltransferase-like protein [Diplodia corticola]|uniref:Acyltransferase-like protein n=1 Tax=Diplodia corticola TaxID=236234 RepID=A0A1J9RP25_9PEZI|nr:acyltransferase-like protein [Diplodia corticola]OJD29676.1 acyltransferase-like protein [Diplodia corticola]
MMETPLPLHKAPPPRAALASTAWLNGLRGMASVVVALNHYLYGEFAAPWLGFGSSPENRYIHQLPFLRIVWCGHAMPPIFFVVSGYCACYSALRLRDSQGPAAMAVSLSRSGFRRGLRLYVPVFVMSALAQLLLFCGLYNWRPAETTLQPWRAPVDHLKYLAAYLLDITNPIFVTDNPGLNEQYWVIPVEYAGSLTIYLTALALAGVRARARPAVLAALIAPFVYRGNCNTYTFLAGYLIAELSLLRRRSEQSSSTWRRPAKAALFIVAWYFLCLPNNYAATPGYSFLTALQPATWGEWSEQNWRALAAVLLVFSMSLDDDGNDENENGRWLQWLPRCRVPQYISTISWEIYLCHLMVYRLWRNPLIDFFMRFAGFEWSFVASVVVMATTVHWCAERLKSLNKRLVMLQVEYTNYLQDQGWGHTPTTSR